MPKRTALCVSSLHRTPLARYPADPSAARVPYARAVRPTVEDPAIRHLSEPRAAPAAHAVIVCPRDRRCRRRFSSPPPAIFTLPPTPTRAATGRVGWRDSGQHRPGETRAPQRAPSSPPAPAPRVMRSSHMTSQSPGATASAGTWSFSTVGAANETVARAVSLDGPSRLVPGHRPPRRRRHPRRQPRLHHEPRQRRPRGLLHTPSNGFDYSGTASFTVQTGDIYGFVLRGSNSNSNDLPPRES